jgi:hypothetical protein
MLTSKRTAHIEALRNALNPLLKEHGASIGEGAVLWFDEEYSLAGILRCLVRATKDYTLVLNFALGKCWACMDGNKTEVLRSIVGSAGLPAMRQRLMNCATVYRRWEVPQKNLRGAFQSWNWHREHGVDHDGNPVRRVATTAQKQAVMYAAYKLGTLGPGHIKWIDETGLKRYQDLVNKVAAMRHMEDEIEDDDVDEFADTEEA